jgi:hypothetical protein
MIVLAIAEPGAFEKISIKYQNKPAAAKIQDKMNGAVVAELVKQIPQVRGRGTTGCG